MTWIFCIIGAVFGGGIAGPEGILAGGVLGYLFAAVTSHKQRITELEKQLNHLESKAALRSGDSGQERASAQERTSAQERASAQQTTSAQSDDLGQPLSQSTIPTASVSDAPAAQVSQQSTPAVNTGQTQAATMSAAKAAAQRQQPSVAPPKKPAQPTPVDKLFDWIKRYFTEGNLIVRVGVIVLFFGVSFLVKYSIDHSLVPIELRLAGIFAGAMVMLVVGWRLRLKTPAYGLVLQGGAVAIMYLAIFSSFKLYHLLPAGFTFPLLIVFSLLAMILAVLQNSRALAVIAIAGGFASPILISTGSNDYIALFSYYMVLNLAIFAVSWFKSWRLLNVVGFAFTFIIGTFWGVTRYQPENFATTEPFLIGFFLIYVAVSVLFAVKQKPALKGYVDGTLVFGVPVVGFGLQAALVHEMEYGLAWSAFALAGFYLLLVKILWRSANSNFRLLCEAMLALGVIFATLTISFALDGRWTAAAWAIEGAGFIWIGIRQQRDLVKYFGMLVQLVGGALFLSEYPYDQDARLFLNTEFMGVAIVSIAGLLSSYLLDQGAASVKPDLPAEQQRLRQPLAILFLAWSLCWWYIGGLLQVWSHAPGRYAESIDIAFFTFSALLWLALTLRLRWRLFAFFPWLLVLPLCVYYVIAVENSHIFAYYGYLAWPLALAVCYGVMSVCERRQFALSGAGRLHSLTYLLLVAILCFESSWLLRDAGFAASWAAVAVAAVLIIALQAINRFACWPFTSEALAYRKIAALVLVFGLLVWSFGFNFFDFLAPRPLPYIPLFNPIDVAQMIAVFVVYEWIRRHGSLVSVEVTRRGVNRNLLLAIPAAFCFIWFNVVLFKSIHVFGNVAYRPDALFDSATVQMAISISWTLIGLAAMVLASGKERRQWWIVGAALTGVVVAKLFLLDLTERGTIERIVSFMIVGVLLLVVGYFSPIPPSAKPNSQPSDEPGDELGNEADRQKDGLATQDRN